MSNSAIKSGFTLVELLVVILIIIIMTSMAAPVMLKAQARGAVNESVNAISRAWLVARTRALQGHPALTGEHYGIVLVQRHGERPWVGVVLSKAAALASDPADALLLGSDGKPVYKMQLKGSVTILGVMDGSPIGAEGEVTQVLYAQFRTGMPLDPKDVAEGKIGATQPAALGLESLTVDQKTRLATELKIGYKGAKAGTGMIQRVAIHQVGLMATEEL